MERKASIFKFSFLIVLLLTVAKVAISRFSGAANNEKVGFNYVSGVVHIPRVYKGESQRNNVFVQEKGPLAAKSWSSYDEYLDNQKRKLRKSIEAGSLSTITSVDNHMEKLYTSTVFPRLGINFSTKKVLCLAARLGGEVRAFHRAGAFALGVDLNPGLENKWVVAGDFHDLQFHDDEFDFVFTNAFDHAYDLGAVSKEICRVLSKGGIFLLDIGNIEAKSAKVGNHESLSITSKPYELISRLEHAGPMEKLSEMKIKHELWESLYVQLKCL